MGMEQLIKEKALELGYEKCGIIPIQYMEGYDDILYNRMEKVPASKPFYQRQERLTKLTEKYPWAKSVIVTVSHYGHYKIPKHLEGHIAKLYLFDGRVNEESMEYRQSEGMEEFLQGLSLKTLSERKFGLVGMRWAAMKAGLGIVRRNNFFYTESGSWVELEAWITDRDMELIETPRLQECPKGCSNCMKACPTCSLSEPYTMNPMSCISFLTTFGGRNMEHEERAKELGPWIYGCDACPMNHKKWKEEDEFPHEDEMLSMLTPENIMRMDEDYYKIHIQPKFFYLTPDDLWKWKINVLNFMNNNYLESYGQFIMEACEHKNEKISEFAKKIAVELGI